VNRVLRSTAIYVFVVLVALLIVVKAFSGTPGRDRIDTLSFTRLLEGKQVATAKLYDRDHVIKGELKDGKKYEIKFPDRYTDEITDLVVNAGVHLPVDNQKESVWLTLLFNFAPFVLIIVVIAFFMNQVQGGGNRVMSFGKARPKMVSKDTPKVTFADVAGHAAHDVHLRRRKPSGAVLAVQAHHAPAAATRHEGGAQLVAQA